MIWVCIKKWVFNMGFYSKDEPWFSIYHKIKLGLWINGLKIAFEGLDYINFSSTWNVNDEKRNKVIQKEKR